MVDLMVGEIRVALRLSGTAKLSRHFRRICLVFNKNRPSLESPLGRQLNQLLVTLLGVFDVSVFAPCGGFDSQKIINTG